MLLSITTNILPETRWAFLRGGLLLLSKDLSVEKVSKTISAVLVLQGGDCWYHCCRLNMGINLFSLQHLFAFSNAYCSPAECTRGVIGVTSSIEPLLTTSVTFYLHFQLVY